MEQKNEGVNPASRIVEIRTPAAIVFGVGSSEQLSQRIRDFADGTVLIVTDAGLVKAKTAEKIKNLSITKE